MRVRGGLSVFFLLAVGALASSCAGRSRSDCGTGDCSEALAGAGGKGGATGGSSGGSRAGRPSFGGTSGTGVGGSETGGGGVGGSETGGAGVGGSETGGSSTTGGTGAAPGAGGGGTSATGGSSPMGGGSNMAGAGGGSAIAVCYLPPDGGSCLASFPRWFYEASSGVCREFTYGGCDGNANNFDTEEECQATCRGQAENDATRCERPSDCRVVSRRCCACAEPNRAHLLAVNAARYSDPCNLVDCTGCLNPEPEVARFGATCTGGYCELFDSRELPVTECELTSECQLRRGLQCCASCSSHPSNIVAVNLAGGLDALACGEEPVACDDCVAEIPPEYAALCSGGRCVVTVAIATE